MLSIYIVNQFNLCSNISSDCSTDHTCFGHADILKYITNMMMQHLLNMPLGNLCHLDGGKTGKTLGPQIDITNTLSVSMFKIFSQLILYHIMDDR